jgi:hypothetical protein
MIDHTIKEYLVIPAKAGIHEHRLSPAGQWPVFMDPGLRRDDERGGAAAATRGAA